MKKTVFPSMGDIIDDFTNLEKNFSDMKAMFTLLCMQQDDSKIEVTIAELETLPAGANLEVSFDKEKDAYVFKYLAPAPAKDDPIMDHSPLIIPADDAAFLESTSLPADDQSKGGLR